MRKLKTIALATLAVAAIAVQTGCSTGENPSASPSASPSSQMEATASPTLEPTEAPTETLSPSPEASPSTEPSTGASAEPSASQGGGSAQGGLMETEGSGELITGTYFTCRMPGKATVEEEDMDDEEMSSMGITAKMYSYLTPDEYEMFAVMEMDWSGMMESFESITDDSGKQMMTETLLETFGGDSGAKVVDLGGLRAIEADESVLSELGMDDMAMDGTDMDVYLAYYDQAYIVVMYAGKDGGYNADNRDEFTASFKPVGLTSDFITLGD